MSDRMVIKIMTGQPLVTVIIGCCTVISPVMHGDEIPEADGGILPVMLEKMRDELRYT